ncbi:MAG: alpha-L-fucosidase [Ferruginibacter sp.]|nr:alpha-L-fucosidase [Cytophagales bacterium]
MTAGQRSLIFDTIVKQTPRPTPQQLAWQRLETIAFAHFTINTFTDQEWGDGTEDPKMFNPGAFDARQWAKACREAGLKLIILTAKHHDGFCLWPSQYTDHSVKRSPWRGGKGDVVKEVSDACREFGLKFGVYLSPWDRHEPSYGTPAYNQHYLNQLRELLTNYGEITEVWLDGAKGEGEKAMVYDFNAYWQLVRELQPKAVLFSDAGPDVRWIGNERGFAGETCWSTVERSAIVIGGSQNAYLNAGDPAGGDWVPGECDVSIRPGWFYHAKEDGQVKSLRQLLDVYYHSVGRNGVMLLNIPPDRRGLFHPTDVARLKELRTVLDETFRTNLVKGAQAKANQESKPFNAANVLDGNPDTHWLLPEGQTSGALDITLPRPAPFDRVLLQEAIGLGQRIKSFTVDAWEGQAWKTIARGTTIGHKRLLRIPPVTAARVRVSVTDSYGSPAIAEVGLFRASAREAAAK